MSDPAHHHAASSDDEKPNHISSDHDEFSKTEKAELRSATDAGNGDVPWTFTRCIAIAALCIVYVGSQMILYFASPALNFIQISIHTQLPNWLLTANTLAVAAVCPFVGYLTDLLGRRWICMFGALCLIVSSLVLSFMQNLATGVVAMAIGGVGAGICELTALAGVAEISPQRWRGVTLSLVTFSIIPFMPTVLYLVLIEQASSWRWCFRLCAIWNFIGLVGLLFCYKPPKRHNAEGLTKMTILKRIDYVGVFLSIGGVTLFLVGLQAGGYQFPWTSGKVLGPLIVGFLMLAAFPVWEWYGPHEFPIMPKQIFEGQRVVALAYIIVFIAGMEFYSILGFFPIVLQNVYHTSLITLGVRALSYPWAIMGGACIVSFLMSYTRGHVRTMFTLSAAIMTAFTGALAASNPNNSVFTVTMATFAAFGNGATVVPSLTLALYACPDDYIGTTGALSLSSRFVGGSVGTAIYFNVFNNQIMKQLPAQVAPAAIKAGLDPSNAGAMVMAMASPLFEQAARAVPNVNDKIIAASIFGRQLAYAEAMKFVWFTTIPFGCLSVIACLFLPNIKKYMTNRVAVDIH